VNPLVINVLVLIPSLYNTSPGSRFRIEQWALHLEREGFRFTFSSFEDEALHRVIYQRGRYLRKAVLLSRAVFRRAGLLRLVRDCDVVFLYEEACRFGPPVLERLIRACGVPIVFDFCDPIYLPYVSPSNGYLSYLKCFGKYKRICEMSTEVIVGNSALAEFALRYNPNVTVVPITIDTEHYTAKCYQPRPGGPVQVGWSGSSTTLPHLEQMHALLLKLQRRVQFHLKVIGTSSPRLDGVPMSFTPWRQAAEVEELQTLDVGIMPLPDDTWVRLRTQLKVRQYMGVGVPAVASPVGVIPNLILDGVNGFLADSEDQWLDRLGALIEDPDLRKRVGLAGRVTIVQRYSAQVWVPRVKAILERAAAARCSRRAPALSQKTAEAGN
jgi:glycosyltransferase involved in cell wall biosynthesis